MILLTFNILNTEVLTKEASEISKTERTEITRENLKSLLRTLEIHNIKSTFFVEVSLLEDLKPVLKKMSAFGHEIAFYNLNSDPKTIETSKYDLENFLEKDIRGIRQKEITVSISELKAMEFTYISNIENANILFPFKRLQRSTDIVEENGMSIVPESISPYSQIPYNDFVFQVLPFAFYRNMVTESLKSEEFVQIYLDIRQFTDFSKYPFDLPFYRKINSGKKLEDRLNDFLTWINEEEHATSRMKDYLY